MELVELIGDNAEANGVLCQDFSNLPRKSKKSRSRDRERQTDRDRQRETDRESDRGTGRETAKEGIVATCVLTWGDDLQVENSQKSVSY